jgi:hypothetical protein
VEALTLTALAAFVAPFLMKAGEKVTEKTVEALFDSRKELAEKFQGLFKTEIISLGLSGRDATAIEVNKQLKAKPEVKESVNNKIADNQDLLNELVEAFKQMPEAGYEGVTINAEKIAQVNIRPNSVSQTIENF